LGVALSTPRAYYVCVGHDSHTRTRGGGTMLDHETLIAGGYTVEEIMAAEEAERIAYSDEVMGWELDGCQSPLPLPSDDDLPF
jgi:aconitase A